MKKVIQIIFAITIVLICAAPIKIPRGLRIINPEANIRWYAGDWDLVVISATLRTKHDGDHYYIVRARSLPEQEPVDIIWQMYKVTPANREIDVECHFLARPGDRFNYSKKGYCVEILFTDFVFLAHSQIKNIVRPN